jgi:hypothetical protein
MLPIPTIATGAELEYPLRIALQADEPEHIPFAFWITAALRPRTVVDLGVTGGNTYCAFLQAIETLGLETTCTGVAIAKVDDAGAGREAFRALKVYHDRLYSARSTLIRSSLADARERVADGSIDLLHIGLADAGASIDAVFTNWLVKMSSRGVILVQAIGASVPEDGATFWQKIAARFPSFAFLHGEGLGVAYVGRAPLEGPFKALLDDQNADETATIRRYFSRLGYSIADHAALLQARAEIAALKATCARASSAAISAPQEVEGAPAGAATRRDNAIRALRQQTLDAMRFERERRMRLRQRLWMAALQRIPPGFKRAIPNDMKLFI